MRKEEMPRGDCRADVTGVDGQGGAVPGGRRSERLERAYLFSSAPVSSAICTTPFRWNMPTASERPGLASTYYGPRCLGCHTVGYDTDAKAVNGGFDDVAAALKWEFPTVLKAGTYDALPAALKNVGNIQCENCHGPGSQHIALGGSTSSISVSVNSGDCGQCHGALTHHYRSAEWANSKHAVVTNAPTGVGREGCVGCHTAGGFIARVRGSERMPMGYNAISCQTCHEPHGRTTPAGAGHLLRTVASVTLQDGTELTEGGRGLLCMNCHQSRRMAPVYAETATAR